MSPIQSEPPSAHAEWAARAIKQRLLEVQNKAGAIRNNVPGQAEMLLPTQGTLHSGTREDQEFTVAIIGAGCAGLFTAMIFDYLKEKYKLKVNYHILESNTEERLGGRLYSYYFKEKDPKYKIGPHDYYDVGAMRFPDNKIMERTFSLFDKLGMKKTRPESDDPPKWGNNQKPEKGDLIPYFFKGKNTPLLYNDIQVQKATFATAKDFSIPNLPADILDKDPGKLVDNAIKPYTDLFKKKSREEFWNVLLEKVDSYSVRQFFRDPPPPPILDGAEETKRIVYDYNTTEFLETMNFGNRWYDQGVTEMILETLDFETDNIDKDWWCIEGGANQLAQRMRKQVKQSNSIEYGKTVTAMSYIDSSNEIIGVAVKGEAEGRKYDAVFNSAPLGAMQRMNLTGLNLNWGTKQAIRSLGYGASCKVGIRFKRLWWIKDLNITHAGLSKTDLPIRCCVYPSYNIYPDIDHPDQPGVLLVSYTWSQEAERIGALINRASPSNEDDLRDLLFHDLARLHSPTGDQAAYQRLYDTMQAEYLDHYAYNWYADPHTVGGFAYFGPGQFQNMYPSITASNGQHMIIGEAASAHHAWVVGALESAVRGVYQFLYNHSKHSDSADAATRAYNNKEIPSPFGPLPAEFSRGSDMPLPDVKEDVDLVGDFARMQVLFEQLRLEQGGDRIVPDDIKPDDILGRLLAVEA